VFADTSQRVVHQAAWLARRFHAEMILLHVVTPLSYPAGLMESRARDHSTGFAREYRSAGCSRIDPGNRLSKLKR
jgi:nucleotide-binding universal stress UspA family protein